MLGQHPMLTAHASIPALPEVSCTYRCATSILLCIYIIYVMQVLCRGARCMQQHVRQLPAPTEGGPAGCVNCSSSRAGYPAEPASSRQAPHPHTADRCLAQEPGPALASSSLVPICILPIYLNILYTLYYVMLYYCTGAQRPTYATRSHLPDQHAVPSASAPQVCDHNTSGCVWW